MPDARPPSPAPGDRLIDFTRRDPNGRAVGFYETYCGRPVLLIVGSGAASVPKTDGTVVRLLAPGDATAESDDLVDSDGAVTRHLVGDADAPAVAFVLDPALRVVEIVDATDAGTLSAAAGRLAALAWDEPTTVGRTAPVLIVPGVLAPDLCEALIAAHDADNTASGMLRPVDGKPGLVADPTAKIRQDHTLRDPALAGALTAALARRLVPELARAFYFPLTRHEAFKIVRYDGETGGHFSPHRDNTTPDAAHRRYALTINLNTGGYAGGDLVFPEYGPERYAPLAGGAVVFSCALLHAVRPVTAGRRYAVISFFAGGTPPGR